MNLSIGCVVEGDGEVAAVPILIRRLLGESGLAVTPLVQRPVRVPRSRLVKPMELERALELAFLNTGKRGPLVVLLDSDDEAACQLGPSLLERARRCMATRTPVSVCLAVREYESWFIAAAPSLREQGRMQGATPAPADPEGRRGAKEWISANRLSPYSAPIDQPALTTLMDFEEARGARSFSRFERELIRICRAALEFEYPA